MFYVNVDDGLFCLLVMCLGPWVPGWLEGRLCLVLAEVGRHCLRLSNFPGPEPAADEEIAPFI